jgi:hypothetical protein
MLNWLKKIFVIEVKGDLSKHRLHSHNYEDCCM